MKTQTTIGIASSEWQSLVQALKPQQLFVSVVNGKVNLGGSVSSYAQKVAAEASIANIPGIRAIHNDIRVTDGSVTVSDDMLAEQIKETLGHLNVKASISVDQTPYWKIFE